MSKKARSQQKISSESPYLLTGHQSEASDKEKGQGQGSHEEHLLRLENDTSFHIKITKQQVAFSKSTHLHKISRKNLGA